MNTAECGCQGVTGHWPSSGAAIQRVICSRFRPIALLCFLSKVLNKSVPGQNVGFLEEGSLRDSLQTGFRTYNNTQTALIKLTADIRMGIDRKLMIFLLLFDFSKAFDTIPSSKLLVKLRNIGFSRGAL